MVGNRTITIVMVGLIVGILNWWLNINTNVIISFDHTIRKISQTYNDSKEINHPNGNNNRTNFDNDGDNDNDNDNDGDGEDSFEWNFLDFNRKALCGADKCLFRTSHHHHNEQVGYLVSKNSNGISGSLLEDGWKISQYLVSRFGIKHFLLEAPQKVNITTTAFSDPNLYDREDDQKNNQTFRPGFATNIQKTKIAPNGSRELRLHHTEEEIFSRLDGILIMAAATSMMSMNDNFNVDEDYDDSSVISFQLSIFLETLSVEVATTLDLLQCEPLMALDFQVFVDIRGNIFHLDFDRILSQFGGLRGYNQTKFDKKVWSKLIASSKLLQTINKWITIQRAQHQYEQQGQKRNLSDSSTKNNYTIDPNKTNNDDYNNNNNYNINVFNCNRDWGKEESIILDAKNLSCLAIERVAMARHSTTMSMSSRDHNSSSTVITNGSGKKETRLRHPLLVALLQRVIMNGYYGNDSFWDCNAYGDRIHSYT